MKKLSAMLLAVLLILTSPIFVFSHSGGTDSSGGHRDNKNASGLGSYHYHHGYGPHLHPNGVCPYSTQSSSSTSSASSTASTTSKSNNQSSTQASSSQNSSESANIPTSIVEKQKYVVAVEKASIYEKASTNSEMIASVKEGYTFTPINYTKSFWKIEFKKKNDDTVYTGYILKEDVKEKSE